MKETVVRPGIFARLGLGRVIISGAVFSMSIGTLLVSATGAVFSDTDTVEGNAFTTGNVDIAAAPASAVVTLPAMAPGDQVTAPLTVSNDGSLELRYSVTSTTDEDVLAAQLDMTIKTGITDCSDGGFDDDGTVVYGPADLGSTGGTSVMGARVLAALASEELCVQVSLPLSTGNAYQDLTTTATFDFVGEQTANN